MLDEDDVDFTILAWPNGGWILGIIGLIVIIVMSIIVAGNEEDCAKLRCERGSSILLHHECLCVEKPETP